MSHEIWRYWKNVWHNPVESTISTAGWAYSRAKLWYDRNIRFDTVSDPYRLITVDPADIDCMLLESDQTDWDSRKIRPSDVHDLFDTERAAFLPERNAGRLLSGRWDKRTKPLKENLIYRSLENHLKQGVPLEDTDLVEVCLERIERGYESYGYSTREGFLEGRLPYLKRLIQSIAEDGYLTQDASPDDHRTGGILHEIGVNVGRDGTLIFNNLSGNNRLAVARILGLEEIPVIVIVRHRQWQAIRLNIEEHDQHSRLSERTTEHITHPDVRHLR